MTMCIICAFETERDDVAIQGRAGRVVCLRCYARETHTERPMPRLLRREIEAALVAIEAA